MFSTVDLFGTQLPYYGIMTSLGIFACFLFIRFTRNKRENIDSVEYICIGLAGAIGAFIMAHFVYGIAHYDKIIYVINHTDRVFSSFQMFVIYFLDIFGGMVFYGGLIGACIGGYIYMKIAKLNIREYSDTIVPCIPLFHAFGRIGCFLAGCCYGIESDFGFTYHYAEVENANSVCRLPIQLFESAENIILCIVLTILLCKFRNIKHGTLIWVYGLTYPVIRFINEFYRGDFEERGYFGVLSTSQWISIIIFVFSLVMLLLELRNRNLHNLQQNESGRGII